MNILTLTERQLRRTAIAALIGCSLFLLYLSTYSGTVNSGDELFIIDTVDSFTVHQSVLLNQTVYERPLQTTDVEPAQPILTIPLYWLAYRIPWIGNVHALFLFTPILTALTAILLYFFLLQLEYSEKASLVGAIIFGTATIVWPYAKTFFREPLTMLMVLGVAYSFDRWRRLYEAQSSKHWRWLVISMVLLIIALSSKEAVWLLVPTFGLLAYPGFKSVRLNPRQSIIVAASFVILVALTAFILSSLDDWFDTDSKRYDLISRLSVIETHLAWSLEGFVGLLVTPGRSVWVYSPILLLSFVSPFVVPQRRWRETLLPLVTLLIYAFAYGVFRGPTWYGGVGWGSRYMVPLVPLLMISAMPTINKLLSSGLLSRLALLIPCFLGIVINIGGTTVRLSDYYDYMQAQTGFAAWQGPGLWTFRWSQAFGSLQYLPYAQPDIAWLLPPSPDILSIVVIVGGILLSVGLLVFFHQGLINSRLLTFFAVFALPIGVLAITFFVLSRLYDDFRYNGHREDLHILLTRLDEETGPDNIIYLNSPSYVGFFMNYYKGEAIWYSLPLSPGERYSCEQTPEVASGVLEEMINPDSMAMIDSSIFGEIETDYPIFLVGDRAPFAPCSTRPVERFMTEALFPVKSEDIAVDVRLTEYLPIFSPAYQLFDVSEKERLNLYLGNNVSLQSYSIHLRIKTASLARSIDSIKPGEMVGVSLKWVATQSIDADYTVGVYILGEQGVVLQQDSPPKNGFAPTSTWQPGEVIEDNYGFVLPEDIPPGQYDIVVVMYSWPSLERIPIFDANATFLGDQITLRTFEIE